MVTNLGSRSLGRITVSAHLFDNNLTTTPVVLCGSWRRTMDGGPNTIWWYFGSTALNPLDGRRRERIMVLPRTRAWLESTRRMTCSPFAVHSGPALDGSDYGRRKSAAYQTASLAAAFRRPCSAVLLHAATDVRGRGPA